MEPSKTGEVEKEEFVFLNCIIDRKNETIELPDGVKYSWWVKGLREKLKRHSPLKYQRKVED